MSKTIDLLLEKISELQGELEEELRARRERFDYRMEKRRIVFEETLAQRQKELKTSFWRYMRGTRPLIVLTAPVIYSVIIAFLLLDLLASIYQAVCFPVYRIPKVRRADYIALDRHKLEYLNWVEKLNCAYCSYANGLIAYVREIASRTEQYWCPIKHGRSIKGIHERYLNFTEFGDVEAYRSELKALRDKLRSET